MSSSEYEVRIRGGGIAGQVLHRELALRGISSTLAEISSFPRPKVCGGVLQPDSWEYLRDAFGLDEKPVRIDAISHFWKRRRISRIRLKKPLFYLSRFTLDRSLYDRQAPKRGEGARFLDINAAGIEGHRGEWIGFQAPAPPVDSLEMRYAKGLYIGLAPDTSQRSHAAFLVHRGAFRSPVDLKEKVKSELGMELLPPLQGTGRIRYGFGERMAVGDARLTTHPFLGLGMKHAIGSARLMADLIEQGRPEHYPDEHSKMFMGFHRASVWAERLYLSPLRAVAWPFLRFPGFFFPVYEWLHSPSLDPRSFDKIPGKC